MTEFLVKRFVKNSENIKDPKVRTSYTVLTGVAGIVCNVFLFLLKLIIGITAVSISVMADAFNNLSDAASSVIGFVGMKLAQRPADREHPFGHGRYEYISALIVAFCVVEVGITCMKNSAERIINPQETTFSMAAAVILIASILIKGWLAGFNSKLGKRIDSKVMLATAADSRGDMLITASTVVSLIAGNFVKIPVDGIIGTIVSILVIAAGIKIVKDTLEPLLGSAADPEICEKIEEIIKEYDIIQGTHDLIIHNYGPSKSMATIHVEVPYDIVFEDAHEIIDRIERRIYREQGIFIVIHMDPVDTDDERTAEIMELVRNVAKEIEAEASIHDFRVVDCDERVNIIFDMLIPYSCRMSEDEIRRVVNERLRAVNPKYDCIITIENSFIKE